MNGAPNGFVEVVRLKEIQGLLEELFYKFHQFCEEYGLVYNMCCGTLLGAVRHGGMIPWDDDIDVTMPREDYDRMLKLLAEKPNEWLEVKAYPMENYPYPYAKVCARNTVLVEKQLKAPYAKLGLYIDVFPLDNIPDLPQKKWLKRCKRLRRYSTCLQRCIEKIVASECWYKKPFVVWKYLRQWGYELFGYSYFLRKHIQENERYRDLPCEKFTFTTHWKVCERFIYEKKSYYNRKLYPFGKHAFWGLEDHNTELTVWYGDYMTPPPEDKRIAKHNYCLLVDPRWLESETLK